MHPLSCAHQPVHLQLLHTPVGPHTQLSTRGTYLGKYELLQLRIALENLSPNSASHNWQRIQFLAPPIRFQRRMCTLTKMHGRGALLTVCLFLVASSHCQRQVLAPLDLSGAAVQATAECGRNANGDPLETPFCTSASTCDICNAGESERSYPARAAVDGDVATAWQSPPLSQGEEFRAVNFTLDLGQVYDGIYAHITG